MAVSLFKLIIPYLYGVIGYKIECFSFFVNTVVGT